MSHGQRRRRVGIYKPIRPNLFTLHTAPDRLLWLDASFGVNARGAAGFPGSTSHYLSRPEAGSRSLSPGNVDFWAAGWFRIDSNPIPARVGLFSRFWYGTDNGREWRLSIESNARFNFYTSSDGTLANSTSVAASSAGTISPGTWYFVLAYHDATNDQIGISVNGGAWDTAPWSAGVAQGLSGLLVGADRSSGAIVSPLDGRVDQLCFGSSPPAGIAATRGAIRDALYNGGSGLSYSDLSASRKTDWGLVSFWELDERTGARADSHGPNSLTQNGTVPAADGLVKGPADDLDPAAAWDDRIGSASFEQATTVARPTWRSAGYLDFDGTDDQLSSSLAGGLIGNRSEFTYLAKVRLDTLPTSAPAVIFEEADSGGGGVNRLSVDSAGQVVASYRPIGGTLRSATGAAALSPGIDYVLGVRRAGTGLQVFVDGAASGSEATVDVGTALTGTTPRVGGPVVSGGFARLDGRIYGLWAAARAFSDPEVVAFSAGF